MGFKLSTLLLLLLAPVTQTAKADIGGSWEGKIFITPEVSLRLVLNVAAVPFPMVTMDSPDQGAYGIPMVVEHIGNDSLAVAAPKLGLTYRGALSNGSINGQFTQGNLSLPLILTPKVELKRPQTPRPPFNYSVTDITFASPQDGATLYGTLTKPTNADVDTPVAVLVSGSGLQNRDEEIFEHKPFAVIAHHLANNGIAALRYDDRGFDASKGLQPNATTLQNAIDAKGAIDFLKQQGFKNIGIIGHSEGGLIADILAAQGDVWAFVIEIGGPAVAGDSILIFQNQFLLRDGNMPEEYVAMYLEAMRGLFQSQKDIDPEPFDESQYEIFSETSLANPVLAPLAQNLKQNFVDLPPWLRYFINYNPAADLAKIKIPVLMIYGEKDTQVAPELNVPGLENMPANITVRTFTGLNHMMQHCETGKVQEYRDIEETISPDVLDTIVNFIRSTTE